MEVEPPVATLPLRVPAACPAAEEAVVEAEAAVLDAEEAEPPQAVRAAAAAAAPQTVRNERREIFFMIEFPPFKPGPGTTVFLCFPWERPYSTALPPLPRPWTCKKCVKLCAQCQPQCKEQVTRHKTKSRRALLFPEVPGGGVYSVLFYAARYVFAVVSAEEHSGLTIVAHTQSISAGAVLFRHTFLGFQIELLRAIVVDRLPRLCDISSFRLKIQRFLCIFSRGRCRQIVLRLDKKPPGTLFPEVPGGGGIRFYSTRPVTFLPLFP